MEQYLSSESLQLIANLINEKNADLKDHFNVQLRMVKTTVQENHALAVETRDLQKVTNGRVNRIEDDLYGAFDKNCNKVPGKDGLFSEFSKIKKWDWLYSDLRIAALIFLVTTMIYVEQSRNFIIKIIDKIF